ncbi:hypothetical protein ACOMHN_002858 [Nucella lapillus]
MALKLVKFEDSDAEGEIQINKYFGADRPDCIAPDGGGDLHCWMDDHRPNGVSLQEFKILARRMFQALDYLDKKSIIHADIKSNNFLLGDPCDPGTLKLCDFGLSDKLSRSQAPLVYPEQFMVIDFRPPEVMLGTPTYNMLAPDMWGVGCVLLHIVLGDVLFYGEEDDTNMTMLDQHFNVLGRPPQLMLDKSKHSRDLLRDPSEYPKDSEKLFHYLVKKNPHWLRSEAIGVYDLVRRTLYLNPETRIRPRAALNHPFIKQ